MDDFISIIRTDRKREIAEYENKGYSILDRKGYRLLDNISVLQEDIYVDFGVEVTERDVYFYIKDDGANAYFTILEIYEMLSDIAYKEGITYVVDIMKKQIQIEIEKDTKNEDIYINREIFKYRGIDYYIKKTILGEREGSVLLNNSGLNISYKKLFTLINLVQEKSNALFLRGIGNEPYKNGLLKLLIVLLSNSENIDLLSELGWLYNEEKGLYSLDERKAKEEKKQRKYYLTDIEYNDIMSTES